MDDTLSSHDFKAGPLEIHYDLSYTLLTTTIFKALSKLFGNGNYHKFKLEPAEGWYQFILKSQSDNGHGLLDAGEIIAFTNGDVLYQWPKVRPASGLHDFHSQADDDGMVRQDFDVAAKAVYSALREAENDQVAQEHKGSKWETTPEKIDRLRKIRQDSKKEGRVTIGRLAACRGVVDPDTVKTHAPELWAKWENADY